MKRSTTNWLIVVTIIFWVIFGMAFFKGYQEPPSVTRFLASTSLAALVQVENRLHPNLPESDNYDCFMVRYNSGSTLNYNFPSRNPVPIWAKSLTSKNHIDNKGFFFSALVLLLFIRFYQSSRTCSEEGREFYFYKIYRESLIM